MRILHVIASMDPADGGPPELIQSLTTSLLSLGHVVEIVTVDPPESPWLVATQHKIHALGPGRFGRYRHSVALRRWLETNAERFDVAIVHGLFLYTTFASHAVFLKKALPYVMFTHGALDPWFKRRFPLKHLKKCLYWPWGDYPAMRDAAAVFFTAEDEKILARQSFYPYRAREVVVGLGTAAPPEDADGRQIAAFLGAFPQLSARRYMLFLGRIDEKKGCDLLIEAFSKVANEDPELLLVIAGPDRHGLRPRLEALTKKLNLAERIIWTGMIKGDIKWGAYRKAEVFVLTSHTENFGIVVAEALACSTPVLISRRVNIWREIEGRKAGMTAEDTVSDSAEMLRNWIYAGREAKSAMRKQAKQTFNEIFEISAATKKIASELTKVART